MGAAALDTFEGERGLYYLNKEHEILANRDRAVLKTFPNVILSPHMAFYTKQAVSDMVGNAVKGMLYYEQGGGESVCGISGFVSASVLFRSYSA